MGERRGTKALELWCKKMTEGYPGVKVENMTTSWRDGLAFCAVIHHFRPELIDFSKLNKNDIYSNNELAFTVAEQYLGIPALLDPADMVEYPVPDRLSILTYLSLFHKAFTHGSSPSRVVPKRPATATERGIVSPASTSPPTKMAVRSGGVNVGLARREPCAKCGLPVFIAERLNVGKQLYHRTCFRCARCNSQLTLQNYYEIETENQYCCETCPDEETSKMVTSTEITQSTDPARLTRSLSDEEKSAGLKDKDDYSCMFETALDYSDLKNTDDSENTKARTQFMSALLDSSDEEDLPPDLPKSKPPELNVSQVISPIVNTNIQSPTSEQLKSLEPSVNNRSFSDVNINQQKPASQTKLDKNTDVVTKEYVQGNTSLVQARMRLFQPAVPSARQFKNSTIEARCEEITKSVVLDNSESNIVHTNNSILSDYTKNNEYDGNSVITISDDSLLQKDEVISISDDSYIQKDEASNISEINKNISNVSDLPLPPSKVESSLDDSLLQNHEVISYTDDSDLREQEGSNRSSIIQESKIIAHSPQISTIFDPNSEESSNKDEVINNSIVLESDDDKNLNEIVTNTNDSNLSEIVTNTNDSILENDRVLFEDLQNEPKTDDERKTQDFEPLNLESEYDQESGFKTALEDSKGDLKTTIKDSDTSFKTIEDSILEPSIVSEIEEYPEDLNPFGEEEPISNYEKSLNPFSDDEDDEAVEMKKITPNVKDYKLKGSSGDTPETLLQINVKRISTNPFEEDDEEVVKPAPRLKKLIAPKISLNPIFPDQLGLSPVYQPEPRPRTSINSGISTSTFGSSSSISSGTSSVASRKKKAAPRPPIPTFQVSPENSVNSSPSGSVQHSPRLRKNRRAPLPPSSTPHIGRDMIGKLDYSPIHVNNSTLKDDNSQKSSSILAEALSATILSPTSSIESGEYEKEKVAKDEVNRNRQSQTSQLQSPDKLILTSSRDKSTYGKWKRKKGQAPSRPIPQKRTIKALPMAEVRRELDLIEVQQQGLEKQGVRLEQIIRERCEGPNADPEGTVSIEVEDLILQLFEVVNEKNELCRRQAELMYLQREKRLEEEHAEVEYQIRCLMLQPDANKTDSDKEREEALISRLLNIVEMRNEIIECLEMDRVREAEEDDSICSSMNSYASKRDECSTPESVSSPKKKDKKKFKKKFKLKMSSQKMDMDKDVDESESADSSIVVKEKKKKKFNLF